MEVQPIDVLEYVTADRRRPYSHALSKRGNPTLSSLGSLLDMLGFKLKIERK